MEHLDVHGYSVNFDASSREGVIHLINSDYNQIKHIFDQAIADNSTTFEYGGAGYKLTWTGSSTYSVTRKY